MFFLTAAKQSAIEATKTTADPAVLVKSESIKKVQFSNANLVMEHTDTVNTSEIEVATEIGVDVNGTGDRPSFLVSNI